MKCYYGVMEYSATGEGYTAIYFIGRAEDEEAFKEIMIKECQIHSYFHIGIEVFDKVDEKTPEIIHRYFRTIRKSFNGFMKFEIHFNYS